MMSLRLSLRLNHSPSQSLKQIMQRVKRVKRVKTVKTIKTINKFCTKSN